MCLYVSRVEIFSFLNQFWVQKYVLRWVWVTFIFNQRLTGLLCHLYVSFQSTPRTGWVRCGIKKPESIADHMYRMATMAFLVSPCSGLAKDRYVFYSIMIILGRSYWKMFLIYSRILTLWLTSVIIKHDCPLEWLVCLCIFFNKSWENVLAFLC